MSDIIRFTNGYIALPDGTAVQADLYVSSSTRTIVSGQSSFFGTSSSPALTVNLGGNLLCPGLIDVQINGAFAVDFSELDVEAGADGEFAYLNGLDNVARRLTEYGTTSFVPTIITQKEELYSKLLRLLRPRSSERSAHSLGYHAEGPFLHPHRRGAHSSALLMTASTTPSIEAFDSVYGEEGLRQEGVKMITLAPDVEGVMDCVEELAGRGVTVSIGHSNATLEQAEEAVRRGARMITHLFNAMPPIHHRDPGVIGLLGSSSHRPYYGMISDGLHLHPNTVRLAYRACKEGCVLVSDAQSIMDPSLPDGVHPWREGVSFRKEGYKVLVDGTDTLAGSAAPLSLMVKNLSIFASVSLPEALLCATYRPAQLLGGEVALKKGQLLEGFDADLCIMTWDAQVLSTWVGGAEVWRDARFSKLDTFGKEGMVNGH